jgi:hypothetical protein
MSRGKFGHFVITCVVEVFQLEFEATDFFAQLAIPKRLLPTLAKSAKMGYPRVNNMLFEEEMRAFVNLLGRG